MDSIVHVLCVDTLQRPVCSDGDASLYFPSIGHFIPGSSCATVHAKTAIHTCSSNGPGSMNPDLDPHHSLSNPPLPLRDLARPLDKDVVILALVQVALVALCAPPTVDAEVLTEVPVSFAIPTCPCPLLLPLSQLRPRLGRHRQLRRRLWPGVASRSTPSDTHSTSDTHRRKSICCSRKP